MDITAAAPVPSKTVEDVPPPARVVTTPPGVTFLTRRFWPTSDTYNAPLASVAPHLSPEKTAVDPTPSGNVFAPGFSASPARVYTMGAGGGPEGVALPLAVGVEGGEGVGMEGLALGVTLRVEVLEGEMVVERVRVPETERDRVKEGEGERAGEMVREVVPVGEEERQAVGLGGAVGRDRRGSSLRILLCK